MSKTGKKHDFENLSPMERRDFLKYLSGFLSAPVIAHGTRFALLDTLLGSSTAEAQAASPINMIEINFRDQWDFGNVFISPSVAKNYENIKGKIIYDPPIAERRNFYVTSYGQELRPHLDTIAVMELGECPIGGIHGHEASNSLRSPGRSYDGGAGRKDMATVDLRPGGRSGGNEVHYSSTPTPLILHNYLQKKSSPELTNGVLLRSSVRTDTHTYYHFEADLVNAQVDRFFDRETLLSKFPSTTPAPKPPTIPQKFESLLTGLIRHVDDAYLRRVVSDSRAAHDSRVAGVRFPTAMQAPIPLAMNQSELEFWKNGIPEQLECPNDDAARCFSRPDKWHPGEVFGYATKLLQSGRIRSVGIDFDVSDVHNGRTNFLLRTQAQQSGMTLARMITKLKEAGLYDKTLIVMYTLDGSRSPISDSYGDTTKNSVVLAGGMINGGYYGDISVNTDGEVRYFRPDDSGRPIADGTTGGDRRVPAADVYKTVMTAAGVPTSVLDSFADVRPGRVLSYMLR